MIDGRGGFWIHSSANHTNCLIVQLSDRTLQRDNVLSQNIIEIQKRLLEAETAKEQATG